MSVEFNLGHQDHTKVEDFLSGNPSGVGAITLHTTYAKHQLAAAEAAREAGADVLYDPRTERLAYGDPDGKTQGVPGFIGRPYSLDALAGDPASRQKLVEEVLVAHPSVASLVTPPSFYINDERSAHLNVALAEATRLQTALPVRPRVLISSKLPQAIPAELAVEFARAGIREIDLRISPLSAEGEGVRKIRQVFKVADLFHDAGLRVILGHSGNIGQVAFALGHVDGYSVGIGENEHVNHMTRIGRQVNPPAPKFDAAGNRIKTGGSYEGIYLPGLAITVSRKIATTLLGHSDIRTRIGCRIGACAASIAGPLHDYKTHYLHSRASEMAALLDKPTTWRSKAEGDRLVRALEMRELINEKYQAKGQPTLKTRTLVSLLEDIEKERAKLAA